ncbi:uncharacterized protein LOC119357603 [Triticum dicoccoides]|uniref:uncharacterized protein LOC119357603 n=1 Tax=Triticum dicoccoides TaxID=85692 RepID=UPI000DF52F1C|nr:uncharacterized protein LOC119357603 [Triticum dicoccoides]
MAEEALAAAMDKLADIMAAKMVAAGEKAPADVGSSAAQAEMVQKIELAPNEVKLEGVENYLRWSRRGKLILRTKSLEDYALGEVKEPEDKRGASWKKWNATDSFVLNWLLSSLSPSVAASVEDLPTAAEVWAALASMYSGKGNVMLVSKIEETVHDLTQGDRTVMMYVEELKHLWADLDYLAPIVLPHAECAVIARKWVEDRRVLKFLKGLDSMFENRRAILMQQAELPSLRDAIAAIAQKETRLKAVERSKVASRPAYHIMNRPETRDCHNCGLKGHLSYQCTAPSKRDNKGRGGYRGSYRGDGRGYYRGSNNRGRSAPSNYNNYNRYQGEARANVSVMSEGQSSSSHSQDMRNEQQGQDKRNEQQAETVFGDFAHFVYSDEGDGNWEEAWGRNQA